jgi:hypothetical protein
VVQADGTLGAWMVAGRLEDPPSTHAALVREGWLYVLGGIEGGGRVEHSHHVDRVRRARLMADGTVGPFADVYAPIPAAVGHVHQAPEVNGRLYLVGGRSAEDESVPEAWVGTFAR